MSWLYVKDYDNGILLCDLSFAGIVIGSCCASCLHSDQIAFSLPVV